MITGINESKTLTKHIAWKCKSNFQGRKLNSNRKQNNDKTPKEQHVRKKDYI